MTVIKESFGTSKDEINVAFDVTVFEELPASIDKQCVLPTEKATVLKDRAVSVDQERDCLRSRPKRILKRDVLGAKVVGTNECAESKPRVPSLLCAQPVGQYCVLTIVTAKSQKAFATTNPDLFFVSTRLDANNNTALIVVGNVIYCLLNRFKVARSICGNN
jgi:hypothetical protein